MNIRQAIFASVASAGVLASGWLGASAPAAQATSTPAPRLGSLPSGAATAAAHRLGTSSSTLSTVRRQQLRGSEPVQLLSGPGYSPAAYAFTQQAALDSALA